MGCGCSGPPDCLVDHVHVDPLAGPHPKRRLAYSCTPSQLFLFGCRAVADRHRPHCVFVEGETVWALWGHRNLPLERVVPRYPTQTKSSQIPHMSLPPLLHSLSYGVPQSACTGERHGTGVVVGKHTL